MSNASIRATGLTKRYVSGSGHLVVLDHLDFEIFEGETLALVGQSGAGKSTLLHLLGGLDRPTSGTIHYGSRDLFSMDARELADLRNAEIGFIWQNQSLLPEFTALENVMMPLLIRGISPADATSPAAKRLEEVGLKNRVTHRAGELSGGEQQRVVLARALVGDPKVLLADEPTGNLDYRTGEMIIDLLRDLHHSHGLTSVYVTHNITFARRCDRILELREGLLAPLSVSSDPGGMTDKKDDGAYV